MLGILLAGTVLLYGCGSDKSTSDSSMALNSTQYATDDLYSEQVYEDDVAEEAGVESPGELIEGGETKKSDRKLIRNVKMDVETTEFDNLLAKISEKTSSLGGYIENSEIYGDGINSRRSRSAEFTLRVPSDNLDSLLETMADNSNITCKSENVQDVTLQYVDIQSKKESLQVEKERLLELIQSAEDIDTIIVLESKLTEVRYQIESLESQLRTYDNQVDYSTVRVFISEVEIYAPVEPESRLEKMVEGFVNSVKGVCADVLDFIVGLVIILPYLAVWSAIIFVCVWVLRFIFRKRKARKEMKKMLKEQKQEQQDS